MTSLEASIDSAVPATGSRLRLRRFVDQALGGSALELSLRLTLLMLLVHGGQSWHLEMLLRVICGLALACGALLIRRRFLWVVLTAVVVWGNALDWRTIDNHKYLMTYWCLVSALAVSDADPIGFLRSNARWLIGLCFLFATVWKLHSGEYVDGSFFYYCLLTDSRLASVSQILGDITAEGLFKNAVLLGNVPFETLVDSGLKLVGDERLRAWAWGLSWWTLFIEGGVALAYLCPLRHPTVSTLRSVLLGAFILSTYTILPVPGFACVLALLGHAQCRPAWIRTRTFFLVVFVAIPLTRIPFAAIAWKFIA